MSDLPDKDYLYGRYQAGESWRQKLQKKLTHKSLDIPEDEDVYVDNSQAGIGWKEMAVASAAFLGGVALWVNQGDNATPPAHVPQQSQPAQQPPFSVSDSEYEVRFFDAEGNPIVVPHIGTRKGSK